MWRPCCAGSRLRSDRSPLLYSKARPSAEGRVFYFILTGYATSFQTDLAMRNYKIEKYQHTVYQYCCINRAAKPLCFQIILTILFSTDDPSDQQSEHQNNIRFPKVVVYERKHRSHHLSDQLEITISSKVPPMIPVYNLCTNRRPNWLFRDVNALLS